MEKTFIANWKSHKNDEQVREFLEKFTSFLFEKPQESKKIILAPSFPFLKFTSDFLRANDVKVSVSAQNISEHEEGAFTGEVAATQLTNIAEYVIIGHSERRRLYSETEETIAKKVTLAKAADLKVILCLQNEHEKTEDVDYIAYEPPSAIGTGNPADPSQIEEVLQKIKAKNDKAKLLYGGSVDEKNIMSFVNIPGVEGFLIGTASLNADTFTQLISKC